MRIAIVLNSSWNVYNFRLGLINALKSNGHHIIVVAPEDTYSEKLISLGYEFRGVKMESSGVNPLKDTELILELYHTYKKINPDVVLHYTVKPNIYGTLAASMLGIPSINNVCGLGTVFLEKGLVSFIAKALYKLAFHFPKKVFFQNEEDYQMFVEENLIRQEIADCIPGSGINVDDFKPVVRPVQASGKFTFLVISRLIYDKGIIEYIDAIKILKTQGVEAHFQLLGAKDPAHKRGIDPQVVDEWIKNGIVEYLGTTDDVASVISQADCVVLPSYREGVPRTLLEAASMGKPIVTTNVPGCRDVVVNGENGFLCEVKNAQDLAEKMRWMSSLAQEDIVKMGLNGRERVAIHFHEKLIIQKYQHVIETVKAYLTHA